MLWGRARGENTGTTYLASTVAKGVLAVITNLAVHVKAAVISRSLYDSWKAWFVWSLTPTGSEMLKKRKELTGNGLRFVSCWYTSPNRLHFSVSWSTSSVHHSSKTWITTLSLPDSPLLDLILLRPQLVLIKKTRSSPSWLLATSLFSGYHCCQGAMGVDPYPSFSCLWVMTVIKQLKLGLMLQWQRWRKYSALLPKQQRLYHTAKILHYKSWTENVTSLKVFEH